MPAELQERVHEEVELTKRRSDWPVGKTLAALGVSRTTYYRWLREEAWAKAQAALETLPKNSEGKLLERPEIRSDNGSCYISREFGGVLDEYELTHRRIKPHCPEENGLMERANRTIDEALEGEKLTDYLQAVKVLSRLIRWYNEDRLHSALGFLRPVDYYRGKPEELYAERRQKLVAARHRRRERNIQLRQPTLPLTNEETVA
jgi:transposase InsO family protein